MKHRKWATTAAMLAGLLIATPAMAGPLDWVIEGWEGMVRSVRALNTGEEEVFHPVPLSSDAPEPIVYDPLPDPPAEQSDLQEASDEDIIVPYPDPPA